MGMLGRRASLAIRTRLGQLILAKSGGVPGHPGAGTPPSREAPSSTRQKGNKHTCMSCAHRQIRTSADCRARPCAYRHTDRPVRHDTGWLPWRLIRLATIWADIAHRVSSRLLPSVTRAGIGASRLESPCRASRRQPGEIPGIGAVDPDPRANTPDRYQAITRELGPDAGYRSQMLRPASPTRMASSGGRPGR